MLSWLHWPLLPASLKLIEKPHLIVRKIRWVGQKQERSPSNNMHIYIPLWCHYLCMFLPKLANYIYMCISFFQKSCTVHIVLRKRLLLTPNMCWKVLTSFAFDLIWRGFYVLMTLRWHKHKSIDCLNVLVLLTIFLQIQVIVPLLLPAFHTSCNCYIFLYLLFLSNWPNWKQHMQCVVSELVFQSVFFKLERFNISCFCTLC